MSLYPVGVRLQGTIKLRRVFGPPGYGETPGRDERLTIVILKLYHSVDVCADTASEDPRAGVHGVRVVQLVGAISLKQLGRLGGVRVEAFGKLRRNVWPTDFADVILEVDSIPALTRASPRATAEFLPEIDPASWTLYSP